MTDMSVFKKEVEDHLLHDLIPFWEALMDKEYGGFYGSVSPDLEVQKNAVKGCILNNRITWFFSNAYTLLQEENLLLYAKQGYEFLRDHCIDQKNGGVYWSVSFDGKPEETLKHTYNQAFSVYALSSYYEASKDREALELAYEIFDMIEQKMRDEKGYKEAFSEKFCEIENDKLSENGVMAEKTMNTLLHVFEAYTELYRVDRNEKVKEKLIWMLQLIEEKIYHPKKQRLEVFFDSSWHSLIDLHSYGHDIETSWLVDRCLEVLDEEELTKRISPITKALAKKIYEAAYDGHSVANECEKGVVNEWRIWWIQAESIVGFLNSFEKQQDEKYLTAVLQIWDFVKHSMIDSRKKSNIGREWYWRADKNGTVDYTIDMVGPWKCPYHNGRMCFEVMKRLQ